MITVNLRRLHLCMACTNRVVTRQLDDKLNLFIEFSHLGSATEVYRDLPTRSICSSCKCEAETTGVNIFEALARR